MKLGVSYNAFDDSIELLEDSIKYIRDTVDFVSVVYQKISNYGAKGSEDTIHLLKDLQERKLIDQCYLFEPDLNLGKINEVNKRNYGLHVCKEEKCTHFMTMDCDEYYIPEQFKRAFELFIEGDYDSSACQMQTYWKEKWRYKFAKPESYYVSLFFKVSDHLRFIYGLSGFGPLVDPSRRSKPGRLKKYTRDEIEMHHMSYVRDDIRSKFMNSSAQGNWKTQIDRLVDHYDNWKFPEDILTAGNPLGVHKVVETKKQ